MDESELISLVRESQSSTPSIVALSLRVMLELTPVLTPLPSQVEAICTDVGEANSSLLKKRSCQKAQVRKERSAEWGADLISVERDKSSTDEETTEWLRERRAAELMKELLKLRDTKGDVIAAYRGVDAEALTFRSGETSPTLSSSTGATSYMKKLHLLAKKKEDCGSEDESQPTFIRRFHKKRSTKMNKSLRQHNSDPNTPVIQARLDPQRSAGKLDEASRGKEKQGQRLHRNRSSLSQPGEEGDVEVGGALSSRKSRNRSPSFAPAKIIAFPFGLHHKPERGSEKDAGLETYAMVSSRIARNSDHTMSSPGATQRDSPDRTPSPRHPSSASPIRCREGRVLVKNHKTASTPITHMASSSEEESGPSETLGKSLGFVVM